MIDRHVVLDILNNKFVADPEREWVDLIFSATRVHSESRVHLNIVSQVFEDMEHVERRKLVDQTYTFPETYTEGFWNLTTPDEAELIGLHRLQEQSNKRLKTWSELVDTIRNQDRVETKRRAGNTKVLSFYSYKGGVGRTTALAHVAYDLASLGKKVVIVDLDIEAPGFLNIFDPERYEEPKFGLVDYFYERIIKSKGMQKEVSLTDIFTVYNSPDITGRLFMVPAGKMSIDFIEKSDFIKANLVVTNRKDYWKEFIDELTAQLNPDYILVDTRTGINEWGAFSLLMVSDKSYFFVYPNEENVLGTKTILQAMKAVGYENYQIIFSRVHNDQAGKRKMDGYWKEINEALDGSVSLLLAVPISIYYDSELAVTNYYPIEKRSIFSPIVEVILEDEQDEKNATALNNLDQKLILEKLISQINKENSFFQRPTYLETYLGDEISIVLGQKGSGKTTLCRMTAKDLDQLHRSDNVIPIWIYGGEKNLDWSEIFNKHLKDKKDCIDDWYEFWLVNLVKVLWSNKDRIPNIGKALNEEPAFWSKLIKGDIFDPSTDLLNTPEMINFLTKILKRMSQLLVEAKTKILLLFDNLGDEVTDQCLMGLLELIILVLDFQKGIRVKVFVDELRWEKLAYPKKDRFKGKFINLIWNKVDFMRMVLRYFTSVEDLCILFEERSNGREIDKMSELELKEALYMLWGIRIEGVKFSSRVSDWVFEELKDARPTIYPEAIKIFLEKAAKYQLHNYDSSITHSKLLSSKAIAAGLSEASKHRWKLVSDEYFGDYPKILESIHLKTNREGIVNYTDVSNEVGDEEDQIKKIFLLMRDLNMVSSTILAVVPADNKKIDLDFIKFELIARPDFIGNKVSEIYKSSFTFQFEGIYRACFEFSENE